MLSLLEMCMFVVKIKLEFEVLVFVKGGKPEDPVKNPQAGMKTNKKLDPHVMLNLKIEPVSRQWDAIALTTALQPLPPPPPSVFA